MPSPPAESPVYFRDAAEWRRWLAAHHAREAAIIVGFHKRHTAAPTMTWAESVDEALCFGWIDGIRRRVDDARYTIRFTPRKTGSTWSANNIRRVAELTEAGRMHPRGLKAFAARTDAKSAIYAYEQRPADLPPPYASLFKKSARAWKHFSAQPPWYRRTATWWVVSAKKEDTRERRLALLIACSAEGKPLPQLDRTSERDR